VAYHGTSRTGARDLAQQARAYLAEKEGIDMPYPLALASAPRHDDCR